MGTTNAGDGDKWRRRRAARRSAGQGDETPEPTTPPEPIRPNDIDRIRAGRPRQVVTARTLAIVAAVFWVPLVGYLNGSGQITALLLVLYVVGAFGAAKGRQGARIMVTITAVLLYLLLLPYCWAGFLDSYPNGPEYAVMDIFSTFASVAGLVLVYRPISNKYFRKITAARRVG
jgi:hypothetical protein